MTQSILLSSEEENDAGEVGVDKDAKGPIQKEGDALLMNDFELDTLSRRLPICCAYRTGLLATLFTVVLTIVAVTFLLHLDTSRTAARPSLPETPPDNNPKNLQTSMSRCKNPDICFIYSISHHGLGSELMNMYINKVYFAKIKNRTNFIADLSGTTNYMRNGENMLEGWFTPDFAIVENTGQYYLINQYLGSHTYDEFYHGVGQKYGELGNDWLGYWATFRTEIFNYYITSGGGFKALYQDLIPDVCTGLQFNREARSLIGKIKQNFGFPSDFVKSNRTVAFHVRRTDKLHREARLYHAEEYVGRLMKATNNQASNMFDYCFLATDDHAVIPEMAEALQNANMTCQLIHSQEGSTNQPDAGSVQERYTEYGTAVFMTEMSMMVAATYFVGTYNSNVGSMVSVLRACHFDPHDHYARSFGADQEDWTLV